MGITFQEKLSAAMHSNQSLLCIGLDPDPTLMPEGVGVFEFNKAIIDATADLVCAYKPNLAFYEALGLEGIAALKQTCEYMPSQIPIIGDAKRGDVGSTAACYARALFDFFGFDAATLNPYLGRDSLEPFLRYDDKGLFLLCRTSNPSAEDFQSLLCSTETAPTQRPLFEMVAEKAKEWNSSGNIGLVVGATFPRDIITLRQLCPDMIFLIPGVGAQGGSLSLSVQYGVNDRGEKAIINSSRQVIYASKGKDFALATRLVAQKLRHEINIFRSP